MRVADWLDAIEIHPGVDPKAREIAGLIGLLGDSSEVFDAGYFPFEVYEAVELLTGYGFLREGPEQLELTVPTGRQLPEAA